MRLQWGLRRLAQFCHRLGILLQSGISLQKALSVIARDRRGSTRALCGRLQEALERGCTFSDALELEGRRFPVLLRRLLRAGEETGGMEDILLRLTDYYTFLRKLWIHMIADLCWPIAEYWMAIAIVATAVAVKPDILGGTVLRGLTPGAIVLVGAIVFVVPIAFYFVASRLLTGRRMVQEFTHRVPLLGTVLRNMGLGRFAWCMEMTTDAGIYIGQALKLSVEASGNKLLEARVPEMTAQLETGARLHEVFAQTGLFTAEFTDMVDSAEHAGQLSGVFGRMARDYFERCEVVFKVVAHLMFWPVWCVVAAIIIYFIFSMRR